MKIRNNFKSHCYKLRASSGRCSERGRTFFKTTNKVNKLVSLCLMTAFSSVASAQSWSNIASEGNFFQCQWYKDCSLWHWLYKSIDKRGWCTNNYFGAMTPAWEISKVCQSYNQASVAPIPAPVTTITATMTCTTMEIANPERDFMDGVVTIFKT